MIMMALAIANSCSKWTVFIMQVLWKQTELPWFNIVTVFWFYMLEITYITVSIIASYGQRKGK